jgi:hypothetical protein
MFKITTKIARNITENRFIESALEDAAQSSGLSEPALIRIFDAHRQLIELRAAQKLNAGQVESNGSVLVRAERLIPLSQVHQHIGVAGEI